MELQQKESAFDTKIKFFSTLFLPHKLAKKKLATWHVEGKNQPVNRPSWTETFLDMAYSIARRSHDSQTQCGCVITDKKHKILGVGYNGWLYDIPDEFLPNVRPDKYDWMLHSEVNAIFNCEHRPEGGIVYVTGHPCLHCFLCMAQVGISQIIYDKNHAINMVDGNEDMIANLEIAKWLTQHRLKIEEYDYHGRSDAA
jgi:dCMP deaminase